MRLLNRIPPEAERLAAARGVLQIRARLLQAIRSFFVSRGYLEVETPVRIPVPALERHIDAEPAGDHFLRTSPEFHMKRLLAAGYEKIFQIGPCFRRGERGRFHHPEYTMLEWYRAGANYLDMLNEMESLMAEAVQAVQGLLQTPYQGRLISWTPPWERMRVADAFRAWAGWDPVAAYDADRFDRDLVERVEPQLPMNRPVVLKDYPAEAAALARLNASNPRVAERWELYAGGLELANAFSELTDPTEMRRRFTQWSAERQAAGQAVYPADPAFLAALEAGLPPSGGVALGVDRLVMLLADVRSLDDVLPFREPLE